MILKHLEIDQNLSFQVYLKKILIFDLFYEILYINILIHYKYIPKCNKKLEEKMINKLAHLHLVF